MTESTKAKKRAMIDIDATETIRKRLGLNAAAFSVAIGYTHSTYAQFVKNGQITLTGALAGEALNRRQAAVSDVMFLMRVVKGVPRVTLMENVSTLKLNGKEFLLVPTGDQA